MRRKIIKYDHVYELRRGDVIKIEHRGAAATRQIGIQRPADVRAIKDHRLAGSGWVVGEREDRQPAGARGDRGRYLGKGGAGITRQTAGTHH